MSWPKCSDHRTKETRIAFYAQKLRGEYKASTKSQVPAMPEGRAIGSKKALRVPGSGSGRVYLELGKQKAIVRMPCAEAGPLNKLKSLQ